MSELQVLLSMSIYNSTISELHVVICNAAIRNIEGSELAFADTQIEDPVTIYSKAVRDTEIMVLGQSYRVVPQQNTRSGVVLVRRIEI